MNHPTCASCTRPAVTLADDKPLCAIHAAPHEALRRRAPTNHHSLVGIGVRCGADHPEYGPGFVALACDTCSAAWIGPPGEPCAWCERSLEIALQHQREILLRPPSVDPDDAAADERLMAWGERLRRGVQAGIVERGEAERAWRKAVAHVAP